MLHCCVHCCALFRSFSVNVVDMRRRVNQLDLDGAHDGRRNFQRVSTPAVDDDGDVGVYNGIFISKVNCDFRTCAHVFTFAELKKGKEKKTQRGRVAFSRIFIRELSVLCCSVAWLSVCAYFDTPLIAYGRYIALQFKQTLRDVAHSKPVGFGLIA